MIRILLLFLLAAATAGRAAEPLRIETTLVDGEALGFATFQSNNIKVVQNKRVIVMTQVRSTNEKYTDGTSLFDHTALAYGSNIRAVHYLVNRPTILVGGGARLKLGQHLVLRNGTPLCNAWLTMLHGLGIEAERHGDSTGVVKQLQA